ncbi:protein of unknown function [Pseudomonas sp. JV551A1]|uniref:Uncharacterized protein n=1 Tax=Pseudomonas inefficax TaxID=2078786 RepID=A0AAQ1PAC1_9PSED|nr:protein of unknown function [Pseudomonas sp. JV551A1]SPO62727.1 protein of unknown function [Pseudomonas inefficax]
MYPCGSGQAREGLQSSPYALDTNQHSFLQTAIDSGHCCSFRGPPSCSTTYVGIPT